MSIFLNDPPCLDAVTNQLLSSSKVGEIKVSSNDVAFASLAALLGEMYFCYWLIQGDGFDVTGWIIKDYLRCLAVVDDGVFSDLARWGRALHDRRGEALAFKKNSGRYVGNYNYRSLHELTRRSDLVLMRGLGINSKAALGTFDEMQRVLSVNR